MPNANLAPVPAHLVSAHYARRDYSNHCVVSGSDLDRLDRPANRFRLAAIKKAPRAAGLKFDLIVAKRSVQRGFEAHDARDADEGCQGILLRGAVALQRNLSCIAIV